MTRVAAIPLRHDETVPCRTGVRSTRRVREFRVVVKRVRRQNAEDVVARREELVDRARPRRFQTNAHGVGIGRLAVPRCGDRGRLR